MGIAGFNYAFIQLSISAFAVTILVTEADFSLIAAGAVLAAVQVAGLAGRVIWGWVADRWGIGDELLIAMGIGNVAGALGMIAVTPAWPVWGIYLFFVTFAASAFSWTGIFMTSTVNRAPAVLAGTVTGGIGAPVYAGVIFGTAALSLIAEAMGGVANAFAVVALLAGIGALSPGEGPARRAGGRLIRPCRYAGRPGHADRRICPAQPCCPRRAQYSPRDDSGS